MLVELLVENYAVIERVRVRFHRGFNLLTGETGSGKSIVVDALSLLFGGRASAEAVRSGTERARISGIFEVPRDQAFRQLLASAGLEPEDGELLIEREIFPEGKSRAFAASRPVTVTLLRDLAPYLGDIHGQHDQQSLFSPRAQLEMLDAFAATDELLSEVADVYGRWRAVSRELEELERTEREKLRLLDLWTFQRREIEGAAPKPGEEAALEQERRVLQNVARLQEGAHAAYSALYDSPGSAHASIRLAWRKLEELCRLDPTLQAACEALKSAEVPVGEASYALRDYLSRLEANPARLEEVESRLAALDRLKRKYGASLEQVLAFLEQVRGQIAALENAAERRAALEAGLKALAQSYETAAAGLGRRRAEAARKLEKRVEAELAGLAMERTVFRVELAAAGWSEHGSDAARFLVSPNVGEEPRPLEKVASGGEISRLALALKTCLAAGGGSARAEKACPRTLVFDEVDAGIGGRAAETVGRRLKQLAAASQVLCVTHLPQIAAFGDHHFFVEKREAGGRTVAVVEEVTGEARTREIGRMLSGERLTEAALRHAAQLLKTGAGG
jgi:DNA repair protein RecN (Recombination protein N)